MVAVEALVLALAELSLLILRALLHVATKKKCRSPGDFVVAFLSHVCFHSGPLISRVDTASYTARELWAAGRVGWVS